jgi:gluconolactonase
MARLGDLIAAGEPVERVATGFGFIEGPVWLPEKGRLYFSDVPGDTRYSWAAGSGPVVEQRPSNLGNGMAADVRGGLVVCEHATSSVVSIGRDGRRRVLASHHGGRELNSPNDVCVHPSGRVYFSDPDYGRRPGPAGVERPVDLDRRAVYVVDPTAEGTAAPEARMVVGAGEFDQPNGLCLSPDATRLYVNDTPRAHIKVFDLLPDGGTTGGRILRAGIGTGADGTGVVDGMKCDERGDLWVTGPGGVWVLDPTGALLGVLEVPEDVGNLTWGGADLHTLFLAASTSLYAVRTLVGPALLPHLAAGEPERASGPAPERDARPRPGAAPRLPGTDRGSPGRTQDSTTSPLPRR